ncbi:hypothetical protein [Reinekea blandensis]|nr:hypothetical protein [Reinekea blandensis]
MRGHFPLILLLMGCLSLTACGNKPAQLQLPDDQPTVTQPDVTE